MAESTPSEPRDPGAPNKPGEIDPDLIKLARARPRVGVITAAGLVALCAVFLVRLAPDRRFAGQGAPVPVAVGDVLAGKIASDQLIEVPAEPVVSHAIRTTKGRGSFGLRVAPVRATGDRLWIVVSGDGWGPASPTRYAGRLRRLDDLALAPSVRSWAAAHPRPVFATAAALRAGLAGGTVATVTGEPVTPADRDAVALDIVATDAAVIAASINERLPDAAAWRAALGQAGITPARSEVLDPALGQLRFHVAAGVAATTAKLEAAGLWAARVEPVTRHHETTWGALRTASPPGLTLDGAPVADAQIDLIGLYVARGIPGDAYALVTGERPEDYWYVMPITVGLAVILLVFAWALVRAVRRDVLPPRPA